MSKTHKPEKELLEGYTASPEQLAAWEAKHGEISRLQVGDKACYLRKPRRSDFAQVNNATNGEYMERKEFMLNQLWLAGDEEIKNDDDYFLNAIAYLDDLIVTLPVTLK
jgi:hypothetical protein